MTNKHLLILCASLLLSVGLTRAQSPYVNKVYDYMPAPGQFVNELPKYAAGDNRADMIRKAEECIADDNRIMISLGGYGGYVIFGFDHLVPNVPGKYDFKVLGNAFYANANPNPDAPREGGSCEPGIVMVSFDANGNGLPDDPWYELAGSEYYKPETLHNYEITYHRPDENKPRDPDPSYPYINDRTYIRWTTNGHGDGYLFRNTFHNQSYYPRWTDDETLVFNGTRLADNYVDESGTGTYYVQYSYPWGYVDNHPNTDDRSGFSIGWAVDADGNSVELPGIHFVKVYTGVNQYCGWLGETSTEVLGAEDLHLTGKDAPLPTSVQPGTTVTLNLAQPNHPVAFEMAANRIWRYTYSNDYPRISFNNGVFTLTHLIDGDGFGSENEWGYWDGFTCSRDGDNTNYGQGNSQSWVAHQFGNMAGGGIKTDAAGNVLKDGSGKVLVDRDVPYLVAYWGYYRLMWGTSDNQPLQVNLDKTYKAVGVYINNHPWPYYGNITGDGFARPFDRDGDYFQLTIHALDANGRDNGKTVVHNLARNTAGTLRQSPDWEWVDLSPLGDVGGMYFSVESTDNDPVVGINTAAYFCMDKLTVRTQDDTPPPLATVPVTGVSLNRTTATSATVYPNPFADRITIETPVAADAALFAITGKTVWRGKLRPGSNPIDASALPPGVYVLKYGSNTVKLMK